MPLSCTSRKIKNQQNVGRNIFGWSECGNESEINVAICNHLHTNSEHSEIENDMRN